MAFTQEKRQLAIKTPLGEDKLLLTRIEGEEFVSGLFEFKLDMVSEEMAIKPQDIVGKNVTVTIKKSDGEKRFINGFVKRFRGGRSDHRVRQYQAEIVPWLWFLTRTTDCKIFQEMTVPDIIEQVFGDYSFADFSTEKLTQSGATAINSRTLEYCVQYRETDFNFISRLLEDQGVHYYFEHDDGKHTMVLGDAKGTYGNCEENEVEYIVDSQQGHGISEWFHDYEVRSSEWAYTDYDFKNPKTNLLGSSKTLPDNNLPSRPGDLEFEYFDYPGDYNQVEEGRQLAEIRMGEDEQDYNVVNGKSGCRTFTAGKKFKIKDTHLTDEDGKSYVLTRVKHFAAEPANYESGSDAPATEYNNEFTCVPDSIDYRPPRVTEKPFVKGPQPAIVVGPSGSDVYPDEYGRVKVQFYWDRYGENNEQSTCWIRVSQTWAGNTWGSMHIPWVGQEVVVDFYEGNPDRPIITGRVYNDDQKVPLNLPDHKYKNVVARDEYGNEIVFDHTEGNEHIRIHSPHHNSTLEVGQSVAITTTSSEDAVTIGDKTSYLYGDKKSIHHGYSHSFAVGPSTGITVGATFGAFFGGNIGFTFGAKSSIAVAASFDVAIGPAIKVTHGKQVELNDAGFSKATKKDIRLDSNQMIALFGGADDKSLGRFDNKGIYLGFDSGSSNRTEMVEGNAKKYIAMGVLSAVGSISAAATGVFASIGNAKTMADAEIDMGKVKKKTFSKEKDAELKKASEHYAAPNAHAMGATCCGIASASLTGVIMAGLSLKSAPEKDATQSKPDSELTLDARGVWLAACRKKGNMGRIGISAGSGNVDIAHEKGKNHVTLGKLGGISIDSKTLTIKSKVKSHFKKGQIVHKNFKVL